jgi:hypothetical protein
MRRVPEARFWAFPRPPSPGWAALGPFVLESAGRAAFTGVTLGLVWLAGCTLDSTESRGGSGGTTSSAGAAGTGGTLTADAAGSGGSGDILIRDPNGGTAGAGALGPGSGMAWRESYRPTGGNRRRCDSHPNAIPHPHPHYPGYQQQPNYRHPNPN